MSLRYHLFGIPKTEEEFFKRLAEKGITEVKVTLDTGVDITYFLLSRAYYDVFVKAHAEGMRDFRVSAHHYSQRHSHNFNSSLSAAWAHNVVRIDREASESGTRFVRRLSEQEISVTADASLLDEDLACELHVVRI